MYFLAEDRYEALIRDTADSIRGAFTKTHYRDHTVVTDNTTPNN
jgi:hypothetical protein